MPSLKKMMPSREKKPIKRINWPYRLGTWSSRALPDFLIIGAMKSGTSSLFFYLTQHPQLFPSIVKEVHFFDRQDRITKGQEWYRAHFPLREKMRIDSKTFEASPRYIFDPLAPKRIFDLIPKVKIIAVLRNPTERAISHYFNEKRENREPLSIFEALQKEEIRLEPSIKEKDYNSMAFIHYSYKQRGLYKKQIERYLKYFPRQQLLVLSSEELFSEPDICLKQIFDFVGVDTEFKVKDIEPRNVASNRHKVDPSVYRYLNNYFMPHNQALYKLIGKSYAW